jgi:glycosyltransferase involved in cell wall biosynthesis
MLTVIIPTHNSERALVPTLAMLVPGALNGTVRDVIVADGGSTDGTAQVVDVAGCDIMVSEAPLAARLTAAVARARGDWLLFLRPGVVIDGGWPEEASRLIDTAMLRGDAKSRAAVFRCPPPDQTAALPRQILSLVAAAWRGPYPEQGLMLSRDAYTAFGGHRADVADPEADLLRRIGRRRIVTLRSAATGIRRDS